MVTHLERMIHSGSILWITSEPQITCAIKAQLVNEAGEVNTLWLVDSVSRLSKTHPDWPRPCATSLTHTEAPSETFGGNETIAVQLIS